jgi:aryl-alcohol dehydrogenase-like predicted oxidoreductase
MTQMRDVACRIALGGAQFGGPYGAANLSEGMSEDVAVEKILEYARNAGVDTIDTAASYGASEQRLGDCGVVGFKVITKLPVERSLGSAAEWVERSVKASLKHLRRESLDGLLLHRPGQLFQEGGEDIQSTLLRLKREGRIVKLGVSIYDPSELEKLSTFEWIELVQAPFNILDDRLETSGWLARLNARGIEVHARSVFLQGLLLMKERPAKFRRWDALWEEWDYWLRQEDLAPLEACLRHALSCHGIDKIVVGVDTAQHLGQILSARVDVVTHKPTWRAPVPEELIDPSRWPNL